MLSPPDYNVTEPAATLTWPNTDGIYTSYAGLTLGQITGSILQVIHTPKDEYVVRRLVSSLSNKSLDVVWTQPMPNSYSSLSYSQNENFVIVTPGIPENQPVKTEMTAYSMSQGKQVWNWERVWYYNGSYSGVGTAVNNKTSQENLCGVMYQYVSKPLYTQTFVFCVDPSRHFNVTLNITVALTGTLYGTFQGIYQQWALVLDTSSGDLLAYDAFGSRPDHVEGLPAADWTLSGQSDLKQFMPSESGDFALGIYKESITRFDRIQNKQV